MRTRCRTRRWLAAQAAADSLERVGEPVGEPAVEPDEPAGGLAPERALRGGQRCQDRNAAESAERERAARVWTQPLQHEYGHHSDEERREEGDDGIAHGTRRVRGRRRLCLLRELEVRAGVCRLEGQFAQSAADCRRLVDGRTEGELILEHRACAGDGRPLYLSTAVKERARHGVGDRCRPGRQSVGCSHIDHVGAGLDHAGDLVLERRGSLSGNRLRRRLPGGRCVQESQARREAALVGDRVRPRCDARGVLNDPGGRPVASRGEQRDQQDQHRDSGDCQRDRKRGGAQRGGHPCAIDGRLAGKLGVRTARRAIWRDHNQENYRLLDRGVWPFA